MLNNWQIVLGGEGGQGLVLAGIILGEAAVSEGWYVAQTAEYGIASRGGFAKSEVVLSTWEIEYPAVEEPNVVLALSRGALDKYFGKVAPGCTIMYDCSGITGEYSGPGIAGLPLTGIIKAAKKESGLDLPLNILSLGALSGFLEIVRLDSLELAVAGRFRKAGNANLLALEAGFSLGRSHRQAAATGKMGNPL